MCNYEKARVEYKKARELYWKDKREMEWAIRCWESHWPQDIRDAVKKSFSWD